MTCELHNDKLKKLLAAHGLECVENENWLMPNGQFPIISMNWYPNSEQHSGVLQIDVKLDEVNCIQESFVGIGIGDKGLVDGIHNFCLNSLHVLLSAFWGIHDKEQVEIKEWLIDDSTFTVYIGPFGIRSSEDESEIPKNTSDIIESAIIDSTLTGSCNWFRNYFCQIDHESKVYESLQNNEEWATGKEALESINWHQSDSFYSVRNFAIVIKQPE